MSRISIIGTGNMARAIGALAVAGGNTVGSPWRRRSAIMTKAFDREMRPGAPPAPT
jgi:8-hydroxy-5-deazaflavin:NADPH oxidoreductase